MSYHVINCDQGSEEWLKARAGVITASMFSVARSRTGGLPEMQQKFADAYRGEAAGDALAAATLAGYKNAAAKADELMLNEKVLKVLAGQAVGEFSTAALEYSFRVAFERISGEPLDEGHQTWQMQRGHELEPDARAEHQIQEGVFVERAGFVVTDDWRFGASADGLIDLDGGSEYKCLVSAARLRAVLLDGKTDDFTDQVQGCMWVTGRKWWHLGFYCPQLKKIDYPLHLVKVARDDDYINAMEQDLLEFKEQVDRDERRLRALSVANNARFAEAA